MLFHSKLYSFQSSFLCDTISYARQLCCAGCPYPNAQHGVRSAEGGSGLKTVKVAV
uniref:Uncharacterized protein n=1 Tax=Anguilla anguilla TaxID=7936 RepID=A0A0E9R850_ANGAN